jgi:hypothetical protein
MSNGTPDKVFTIALSFELGQHKASRARLRAAYDEAVTAAVDAVESELLPGSIVQASSTMAYDYRFMARTETLSRLELDTLNGNGDDNNGNGEDDEL